MPSKKAATKMVDMDIYYWENATEAGVGSDLDKIVENHGPCVVYLRDTEQASGCSFHFYPEWKVVRLDKRKVSSR